MGSSDFLSILGVLQCFAAINPQSMLDVGVGFGRYGFLARDLLDYNTDGVGYPWRRRIDGIEIFEDYLMPHHRYIYDHIYIGDAYDIVANEDFYYDMIYLGDVIEHFTKEQATELLHNCLQKTDSLVVNTPYLYYAQGEAHGNSHERHLSGWDCGDFQALGAKYIYRLTERSLIAIFTDKELPLTTTAIDTLSETATPNETDIQRYRLMLENYLTTGQFAACEAACKKYYSRFAEDFEVNLTLAYVCDRLSKPAEAALYAEKALALQADSEIAKRILSKMKS